MPQQGWGAAPQQGTPTHWGAGPTPWDDWNEPPPLSAPASLSHGFSATAAPPIESSSSGQPITSSSWFAQGARGPTHGMPGGMGMYNGGMMDDDSDDDEWEKEEGWAEARAQRHAQQHRDPRAGWGQGHTPPAGWPQAPSPGHGHDPRSGWPGTPVAGWPPQDPTPAWAAHELTRTHSQGGYGYPKSPKKKKRSNSFGGGQLPGWGAAPHTFDEQHLSRRPDDWREGYSPRGASGADLSFSSLFRVGRRSSESGDLMDTRKRTLTDVLTFNAQRPNILFDVRRPPEATSSFGSFRPRNDRDLMVPALMPAAARMRLMHPRLPWYIDVKRRQPNSASVTLYDVLRTLYEELDRPIASRDFYNEELGKRDRDNLTSAFKERCAMNGKEFAKEEMLKGVKRVDFLGMDCVFLGLVKRNGMWEIKTGDH
ncbi:hypothetical protein B0H11DRAFT_361621 [Mycena galericulata]|nr:hypothetical protein B0H11DRAFT_361621 [Mycena galericulata]